jgi:hypothetical protein
MLGCCLVRADSYVTGRLLGLFLWRCAVGVVPGLLSDEVFAVNFLGSGVVEVLSSARMEELFVAGREAVLLDSGVVARAVTEVSVAGVLDVHGVGVLTWNPAVLEVPAGGVVLGVSSVATLVGVGLFVGLVTG